MQADIDLGVAGAQLGHCVRQHIARLRVGGGNTERAAVLRAELLANTLEVADLTHDDFNALEHVLAGLCDALEALAMAGKDVNAQFLFQLNDGFGHTRLRCVQRFGGFREVEVAARRFLHESELVEVHKRKVLTMFCLL